MIKKSRDRIEKEIINWRCFYDNCLNLVDFKPENTSLLYPIFYKDWEVFLVNPSFMMDDELGYYGVDIVRRIDGSSEDSGSYFFLTVCNGIPGLKSEWVEEYSSKGLTESKYRHWDDAYTGCYIVPENENWCALYVDREYQDYIVFGCDKKLAKAISASIGQNNFLTESELYK